MALSTKDRAFVEAVLVAMVTDEPTIISADEQIEAAKALAAFENSYATHRVAAALEGIERNLRRR